MGLLEYLSKSTQLQSVWFLQQLCIVNVDGPVGEKTVCGLDASSSLKHRWELLDFIPRAHVLECEQMQWHEVLERNTAPKSQFFTFVMLKSTWTEG